MQQQVLIDLLIKNFSSFKFGKKMRDTKLLEDAGKVASEAVENIRTVQGLNKQAVFHQKYCEQLAKPYR